MKTASIRQFLVITGVAVLLASAQAWLLPSTIKPAQSSAVHIGFSSLQAGAARTLTNVLWVDARTRRDFQRNRIPNSVNLPPEGVPLTPPPDSLRAPERAVVVYGENGLGGESERLADYLSRALHRHVFVLVGGLQGWRGAGGPVEEGGL